MGYIAKFSGWSELTLQDLIVAYRKAKADCFFEDTFPTAIKFAEYEQDLLKNLKALLSVLQSEKGFDSQSDLLGEVRLVPKKLGLSPKDCEQGHAHFSDPKRAFDNLVGRYEVTPEFRLIGDFPVNTHIISALWINLIGHKFDQCLSDRCYGARLKRVRNDDELDLEADKNFHISAVGSFKPYFQPYQKWRNDGLKAIRTELDSEKDIIAVSLDLQSYYHLVDPTVISGKEFQTEIGLTLSEPEQLFTEQVCGLLSEWSKKASAFASKLTKCSTEVPGGLVIGLTASRVISNMLLHRWDQLITEKVTPLHYGRYVDDMFLVLKDPGCIYNQSDLMAFLSDRIGDGVLSSPAEGEDVWRIQLGESHQKQGTIKLQSNKQKLFILRGQPGKDLLDSIEKEIYELSSEHRLMPTPDQLENSTAAQVLSAAGDVAEHADTLRRADGLTIRRLGWSLQLRNVETLARDLPSKAWSQEREDFYNFAHTYVLRPDGLFEHYPYLPRLLGFAVNLSEWRQAEAIVRRSFNAIEQLIEVVKNGSAIKLNGVSCKSKKKVWRHLKASLTWSFMDAVAKYYDPDQLLVEESSAKASKIAKTFMEHLWPESDKVEQLYGVNFELDNFHFHAHRVAICDLAKTPYKAILEKRSVAALLGKSGEKKPHVSEEETKQKKKQLKLVRAFDDAELIDTACLKRFLEQTRSTRLRRIKKGNRGGESLLPYIFPTRPYTPAEIAELAPECVGLEECEFGPSVIWAKYTQAVRGVWVKPTLLAAELDKEQSKEAKKKKRPRLIIGTKKKTNVTVAISNLMTSDNSWELTASNKPDLTLTRYKRISALVNHAIKLNPKPDYLILPELSLPLKWVSSVTRRLSAVGISLVAGTEYRHIGRRIHSEACLHLSDDRLGFPSAVRVWQPKLRPAVGEDRDLISRFGKKWLYRKNRSRKPVYVHNDFNFGVLVCSELSNSKERIGFQGNVDAMMVLAWNQDLDTFSSLIESAALDVHAYTILVNNRKYGDSRVRVPAKDSFRKDLARLRGGDNDFCVAVKLDLGKLRAFQSRSKRWANSSDPFKPVPEGFRIHPRRRKMPPK